VAVTAARLALAAPGDGSAGGLLARAPLGARSQALGGAYGALGGAPESFLANPAAAGMTESTAVVAAYDQGVEGVAWNGLVAVHPVLPWLSAGAGVATLSSGTVEAWDAVGGSYHADLEQDRMGMFGGSATLGPVLAGASLKYTDTTLLGSEHATAILADLGLAIRFGLDPPEHWDGGINPNQAVLSFAAGNLGTSYRYGSGNRATDPPPTLWRTAASVATDLGAGRRMVVIVGADVPRATARLEARAGAEVAVPAGPVGVALRAGARLRRDRGSLTVGLGVSLRGCSLDYAFQAADDVFAATHHVSAGFDLAAFRRQPPVGER
jgi:hypothetical protein